MSESADPFEPRTWQQEACYTRLHVAAHDKSLHHHIPELLSTSADHLSINAKDIWLRTPLFLALETNCSLETLEVLLKKGANVRARNKFNDNALHYCLSGKCDLSVLERLLDNCKDLLNDRNNLGDSPIANALFSNSSYEVFRALMDAGAELANVNREHMTSLHHAAMGGCCKEILNELMEIDREWVRSVDSDGRIPLHFATKEWVVAVLLKAGSNPKVKDKDGCTPLHYMVQNASTTATAIEQFLQVLDPLDVLEVDHKGDSYLHHAVVGICAPDVICALLNAGLNPSQKNKLGNTALHCAVIACDDGTEILKVLLRTRPTLINEKNLDGKCALELAEDVAIAKKIIKWVVLQDCDCAIHCVSEIQLPELQNELLLYLEKCTADVQALKQHTVLDDVSMHDLVLEYYLNSQEGTFWKRPFRTVDFQPSSLAVYNEETLQVQSKRERSVQ